MPLTMLNSNNSTNKCEFSFDRVNQTLVLNTRGETVTPLLVLFVRMFKASFQASKKLGFA